MHRAARSYASTAVAPTLTDDEVVRTFAPLIDRVARRIAARTGHTVQPGDLWAAGAIGLLDAYHRFDANRAVKFESFAEHRIRGAMIDELREMDHLPRRLRADADRVRKARHALGAALGREPTLEELATKLALPIEDVATLDSLGQPVVPLSPEVPLSSEAPAQDEQYIRAAEAHRVQKAIERLSDRLQLVLSLHYVEGLTYKEIALALEVSEARVCQLHADAVRQLRALLQDPEAESG